MSRHLALPMRLGWTAALLALAFFFLGLAGAFHFHSPDGGVSMHACAVCLHLQGTAHAAAQAVSIPLALPSSFVVHLFDALSLPKAPLARLAVRAPPSLFAC